MADVEDRLVKSMDLFILLCETLVSASKLVSEGLESSRVFGTRSNIGARYGCYGSGPQRADDGSKRESLMK